MKIDTKTIDEEFKLQKEEEDKQWQEVREGKRDLLIVKSDSHNLQVYPEGHRMVEFICHRKVDDYIRMGYIKVMTKEQAKRYIELDDERKKAHKNLVDFEMKTWREL